MVNYTDLALEDVGALRGRTFGRRAQVPVVIPPTVNIDNYKPCAFNEEKVDATRLFDVFVKNDTPDITQRHGWNYASTHESAAWAWTAQNMIRKEHPHMRVKVMSKPRGVSA